MVSLMQLDLLFGLMLPPMPGLIGTGSPIAAEPHISTNSKER
jgi:hypothetical protein